MVCRSTKTAFLSKNSIFNSDLNSAFRRTCLKMSKKSSCNSTFHIILIWKVDCTIDLSNFHCAIQDQGKANALGTRLYTRLYILVVGLQQLEQFIMAAPRKVQNNNNIKTKKKHTHRKWKVKAQNISDKMTLKTCHK